MKRRTYAVMAALGCATIAAAAAVDVAPRLIWNASASVPIGFYTLRPPGSPRIWPLRSAV